MLELEAVSVWRGKVQVLWDISMQVPRGSMVGVVGSNGAGKTTLVQTISGVLRPRNGRITFTDGARSDSLLHRKTHEISRLGLAHVPEGRGLFADLTTRENLLLGATVSLARERREETLERVTDMFPVLRERWSQRASSLSGGQQQMLAIGRALMSLPRLLILDEPSIGLAPVVVDEVYDALNRLRAQSGVTILLIEQNVFSSLSLCDTAYVMDRGRVVRSGDARELLADPSIRNAYLGL